MIFKNTTSINEEMFMLKYFFHISLEYENLKNIKTHTYSPTFFWSHFNYAFKKCIPYIPFSMDTLGILGEYTSDEEFFYLKNLLFNHCIIRSLLTARHLAFNENNKSFLSKNIITDNGYIKYISKNDQLLSCGFFSLLKNSKSNKSAYSYDQNRATFKTRFKRPFFHSLISNYIAIPEDGKSILLHPCTADIATYILSRKSIHALEIQIDHFSQNTKQTKSNLTTSCKTFSTNICKAVNELIEHIPNIADPVDKLLFIYQIEDLFHLNLYTHLMNTTEYFEQNLDLFLSNNNFNFITTENPYRQYCKEFLNIINIPTSIYASALFNYGIATLSNFDNEMPTYLNHLRNPHSIISETPKINNANADDCFHNWLKRISNLFNLLAKLYIPLLEKTFFLALYNYYNHNTYLLLDSLYNQVYTNIHSYYLDSNNIFKTPFSYQASFKEGVTECEKFLSLYSTKNSYNPNFYTKYSNIFNPIETETSISTFFIQKLFLQKDFNKDTSYYLYELANSVTTTNLSSDNFYLKDIISHRLYDITTYFGNR